MVHEHSTVAGEVRKDNLQLVIAARSNLPDRSLVPWLFMSGMSGMPG